MIAEDKLLHMAAGLAAAIFATTVYAGCALLMVEVVGVMLSPAALTPVPFVAALLVGLVKEATDWLDNRQYAADLRHTVDPWDVVATTAPGLIASLIVAGVTL